MPSVKTIFPLFALAVLTLGSASVALCDDDDDDGRGRHGGWIRSRADVAPVSNPTYAEECGACHMAYQPGLLPGADWTRIMDPKALTDHYGDDASLAEDLRKELEGYLTANSADRSGMTRSHAFSVAMAGAPGGSLPRISETSYFVRKHDEIPTRLVTDNPEVGSLSQCNKCHQGAEKGVYNEHQVRIPGYGAWED